MNKRDLLRSLLLLSFCCILIVMAYTVTLEQRWDNYTTFFLHSQADYDIISRRGFLTYSIRGNSSSMNASHCFGKSVRTEYSSQETGSSCNCTNTKSKDLPPKTFMSRSRKSGYMLLDSEKGLDLHCKQCALVFSSGHLVGSKMGLEIDKTECVIRQNMARVRHHELDVGMRTTARVIGHSNFKKDLLTPRLGQSEVFLSSRTRPQVIYIPWLYKESINRTSHHVFQLARDFRKRFPNIKFYFQSDEMINEMDQMFAGETGLNRTEIEAWYSTGLMSVLFALDVCDKVICYGVSDADYCRREPKSQVSYHYYDTAAKGHLLECGYTNERENLIKGGHKFLTEKKLYARWAQHRNLTFRAPTWPKSALNVSGEFESPYLSVYKKATEDGSFANYVRPAVGGNNIKPLTNDKVRRPPLRKYRFARRQVPLRLVKKKGQK